MPISISVLPKSECRSLRAHSWFKHKTWEYHQNLEIIFCNIIRFLPVHFEIIDIDTCKYSIMWKNFIKNLLIAAGSSPPLSLQRKRNKTSRWEVSSSGIILDPCILHQKHTKSYMYDLWSRYAIPGSIWAGCFIPGIHLQPGPCWLEFTKGPW